MEYPKKFSINILYYNLIIYKYWIFNFNRIIIPVQAVHTLISKPSHNTYMTICNSINVYYRY